MLDFHHDFIRQLLLIAINYCKYVRKKKEKYVNIKGLFIVNKIILNDKIISCK